MDNPAIIGDVENRWRPLTGNDLITATTWLNDAWVNLQIDSPGLVDRIVSGVTPVEAVVATLAEAVARKGRNADGKRQESITSDDSTRSWTLDSFVSTGELKFTDAELRRLSGNTGKGRSRAFSVMPS